MTSGGKKDPTYVEDVFSTYLYKGNNAANTVNTGINYSEEGGLLWIKARNSARQNLLFDTVRGANKKITSNEDWTEWDGTGAYNQTFTTTGFTLNNSYTDINDINVNYTSWNFRKQKGFFDIVTWSGNDATTRTLNHGLGSIPGCFMVKRLTGGSGDWVVYHRRLNNGVTPEQFRLSLNNTWAEANQGASLFGNTAPTSTQFTVGDWYNHSGSDYLCYLFAGGESTAATARSVDFDGSGDYLSISDSSDFDLGSGDWTIEGWVKVDGLNTSGAGWLAQWSGGQYGWYFGTATVSSVTNTFIFGYSTTGSNILTFDGGYVVKDDGQYHHYAVTRSSNTVYLFVDGVLTKAHSMSDTINNSSTSVVIGNNADVANGWYLDGKISNLRLIKGTAVYTSSFRPPTEPLTNITNTKLLCCNDSSTTGSTVTPSTITANGNPTASTDSPFDDPEGFKFGEEGDQNIIKCGSYDGNGSSTGPEINLGWEPQWVLYKCTNDSNESWTLYDSMRGIVTGGNEKGLYPNYGNAEEDQAFMDLTPTGYKITSSDNRINGSSERYIYIAIRRPDGYVGKPVEAGTDAFAMDTGSNSSTIPNFDSGFPVDFAIMKTPASSGDWYTGARLTGQRYMQTNSSSADANWGAGYDWDSNVGWLKSAAVSAWQSWMWKRGAGFDVVTFDGDGVVGRQVRHSLNKPIEMIWIKSRSFGSVWQIGHKGLNGGTNPWEYSLSFDAYAEASFNGWNNTAPTSNSISLGSTGKVNGSGKTYMMMLFASVDGISKVGSYTGNDGTNSITTGFQPRFVIIKIAGPSGYNHDWMVLDTTRGWGPGNDKRLNLNDTSAQVTDTDIGAPTSTGFTLVGGPRQWNEQGRRYIYYAHA